MLRSRPRLATTLAAAAAAASLLAAVPQEAMRLKNLGLAQLENEQPEAAAATYRRLIEVVPDDPLGHANLAIAALRQQEEGAALEAIQEALERAPGRPDLLAIQAEVLQWSGRAADALEVLSRAAAAAPEAVRIQYALYRLASSLRGEEAAAAAYQALSRLAELRPENVVVLLQLAHRAIARDDRAAATLPLLRIRELLWQAPPAATTAAGEALEALAAGETAAARIPALRLENVFKVTAMYRQGLQDLSPGIQGIPIERFRQEPPPARFGEPLAVRFRGSPVAGGPVLAAVAADLDGDQRPDLAWLAGGPAPGLRLRLAAHPDRITAHPAPGLTGLLAADLDNDGHLDLIGFGPAAVTAWRGSGTGELTAAAADFGLTGPGATAAAAFDFDLEGDLDLALGGGPRGALELLRNSLTGPLEPVGREAFPPLDGRGIRRLAATDLDRDGDLDLLIAHQGGLTWLENLGQGKFADRTEASGLSALAGPALAVASADLDGDGWPDLAVGGEEIRLLRNRRGRFEPWVVLTGGGPWGAVLAFDADNDGRLDLAAAGPRGVAVWGQRSGPRFEPLAVEGAPDRPRALAAADLDGDGDLDLAAGGTGGLAVLENLGGNRNHWLSVRLRGLDKGSSKNNFHGLGSTLELFVGTAYQFREAQAELTHFGLGSLETAEILRVVWTNGVPQNRLDVAADQLIVEEQLLKGSCPFLYTWDGEGIRFVTDLLWGAPLGLPVAPGVWAQADPRELVRVDGARPRGGAYDLRITEELWEAAYFDQVRLWLVDHPADVEVASTLRIVPGRQLPEAVLGTRNLRPVTAAWDAAGREVTSRVAARDEVYADGWEPGPYQGLTAAPWALILDLGEAPARPVRLHLDGWIFPADASLNLAVAQRSDLEALPPRLEVETPAGWRTLVAEMGHPAGKTKTMVLDTPPLPPGARRLRIVSNLWLSWDRIAWSLEPADAEPVLRARLSPATAHLRERGFSAPVRRAPNAPHTFDYSRVRRESPWLPLPGRYTRTGDVRELLLAADDRSVILAPGDELALTFDASRLPPPPRGWRRTAFLESLGWDKDADRNTHAAGQVEPLPFRGMSGYPYAPGEAYPDTPRHRRYRQEWLTRERGPRRGEG